MNSIVSNDQFTSHKGDLARWESTVLFLINQNSSLIKTKEILSYPEPIFPSTAIYSKHRLFISIILLLTVNFLLFLLGDSIIVAFSLTTQRTLFCSTINAND